MTQNPMIRHVSYDHRPETRIAFHPMSIVSIEGRWTIPVSADEIGHVMRHADSPDIVVTYTHGQLAELQQEGKLIERRDALSPTAAALALRHGDQRPTDLPTSVAATLHFRKALCDEILRRETAGEISRSDASLEDAIGKAWLAYDKRERRRVSPDARCGRGAFTLNRPSPTTMRRWLVRYEKGGFHSTALLPHYRFSGNRTPRLAVEEQAILTRIAKRYASLRKPTIANLHLLMKALVDRLNRARVASGLRPLVCPGRTALAAAIQRMDPFHVYAGREGVDKARRRFHIVNRGLEVERPLERIEVDEWRLPLHVLLKAVGVWSTLGEDSRRTALRIRPWVSTAIDVRTKCVLAVRLLRRTSAASAVAVLEMAVTDKATYADAAGCRTPWDMMGVHETASADNGSSFASLEWRGANLAVGAECVFPQAGRPQMRGTEERLYRTLHDGVIRFFDGRTFGDVVRRGDYDSQANAAIDLEVIGKILTRYLVDVYHNTPHKGLGGQTPRDCWIELRKRYGVRMPPSPDECRHAFGTVLEARIHNDGIHHIGLRYQSMELQRSRAGRSSKTKAKFKVSHSALGHISVETPKGWITVPCMREGMENVSLEQWLLACAELRRKHADAARVSEPAVLEAIRMVHATAEGARRRAGIANPVLKAEDYVRLERAIFSSFDRSAFEDVEILDVVEAPIVDSSLGDPQDVEADFEPILEDRSIEHAELQDDDLVNLFLLEEPDDEEDPSDEDDADTRWKLED